jgi:threonylcarbamoyladenosine tRNA methylthiotransferase MtaB
VSVPPLFAHGPGDRFVVLTLGCKVNQYESQALREAWEQRGMLAVDTPDAADIILVNSCAVTSRAVQDLRATVRRLARAHPGARIVVTGCAAEVLTVELAAMEEIHLLVPQQDKPILAGAQTTEDLFALTISRYPRSRAVLKVQDGCSHGCTYCIVPRARGPSRSRPLAAVIAEARRLLAAGAREITLAGINLRHYGITMELGFWDLLHQVEQALAPEWQGRARLRISSLDPSELNDRALEVLSGSRMVCPHLHLSLQSGSPEVLRRMNRGHYDPCRISQFLDRLGSIWPLFGLGADVLVGFPGETEAEFSQTLELCSALPLSYAHVFPFSQRPGTPAAGYPDQVRTATRRERAARARKLVAAKRMTFLERLTAERTLHLVLENHRRGRCGQYVECRIRGSCSSPRGELIAVRPLYAGPDHVVVRPLPEKDAL